MNEEFFAALNRFLVKGMFILRLNEDHYGFIHPVAHNNAVSTLEHFHLDIFSLDCSIFFINNCINTGYVMTCLFQLVHITFCL